jgi:transglycosylase-like protein with SLT domain
MCAISLQADRPAAGPEIRVIGCERVDVGANSALVRVTLATAPDAADVAADAQLRVLLDGERERCHRALPGPGRDDATRVTLGFAVTRRAQPLALVLCDGRSLGLPEPVVRPQGAVALAPAGVRAAPSGAALDALQQQLRATKARLEEATATAARVQAERDAAREAAAHAEAAAHDATVRAEALGGGPPAVVAPRHLRGRPRRAVAAACAIGSAALVCGILVWPGADVAGERGVSEVAAAPPADRGEMPGVFDPVARRLGIPAPYLALYREAGARYGLDWTRLAAVGAIESRHGQSSDAGVASGANPHGASGPAQFLAGTWQRFGVDGDGDGVRDPHDPADAIAAMASYLRASGAPQDWRGALRTYNHSDVYATAVERLATSYRRSAGQPR